MELEKFLISEFVACAVSITLHVTKCPWLDLVGICKPWDSWRGVRGRMGSCDAEQTLFAIPWLRSDFWEVARGDSTKSFAGFYKYKTFYGDGPTPAWQEVENKEGSWVHVPSWPAPAFSKLVCNMKLLLQELKAKGILAWTFAWEDQIHLFL